MKDSRRYAVTALERGLSILETLSSIDRPLALQEISARTRIPKTTAFRLLATLEGRGFVERAHEGSYRLGLRVTHLGQADRATAELRRAAQPVLQRLHRFSEDTVNLAIWRDGQVLYLDVLPSPLPLRFVEAPGSTAPLHATALGKAIAAHLPDTEVRASLRNDGMRKFTRHTVTGLQRFQREIRRVHAQGFAVDRQEKDQGAACIAAPVFDDGRVVGGISISAPTARMDAHRISRMAPALMAACAAVSRILGSRKASSRHTVRRPLGHTRRGRP